MSLNYTVDFSVEEKSQNMKGGSDTRNSNMRLIGKRLQEGNDSWKGEIEIRWIDGRFG